MGRLQTLLQDGRFVVTAELAPPFGADKASVLRKCEHFRGFVDAVNLTDNQGAMVRMSSFASSVFVLEAGLEPIYQITCRDRNRLAQQSDVLGAAASGIENVVCLTGDHQTCGDQPEAMGVFDLDSTQLLRAVSGMNEGRFMNGKTFEPPTHIFIGATANPFAEPLEMRVWNLAKKIAAGARFIQTQPIFDLPRFEKWMSMVRDEGLDQAAAILAGAMPIKSLKVLAHMRDNVPGVRLPDDVCRRIEQSRDPQEEGIRVCLEMTRAARQIPGVKGVHLMPVMWESIVPRIVEEAGLSPRPAALAVPA